MRAVSDYEHALFEAVAPEAVTFRDDPRTGPAGDVLATLHDQDLVALVGPQTNIHFGLPGWGVIDTADEAEELVSGDVPGLGHRPLAVRHTRGDGGRIFYTSFHNEDQASEAMQAVLLRLILSL